MTEDLRIISPFENHDFFNMVIFNDGNKLKKVSTTN